MDIDIAYYKSEIYEFYKRVGIVSCYEALEGLGLSPRDVIGTFWPQDIEALLSFCKENSDYHIVTRISESLKVNRYVKGDFTYRLAKGEKKSDLEIRYPPELINHMMSELELLFKWVKPEIGF
mgnify:CR=1 FL=1